MIVKDLFDILLYLRYVIITTLRLPMVFRRPRGLSCDMGDLERKTRETMEFFILCDAEDL